jgi:hypothetical protein
MANFADAFWLIVPGFRAGGFALRWMDLCAPVGIGALWWCVYMGQLRRAQCTVATLTAAADNLERSHG